MEARPVDVVCMGELVLELVAVESNVPLSQVRRWTCAAGGAPANVAVALERLGVLHSAFCGGVGNDAFGSRLRLELQREGVETRHLVVAQSGVPTTVVFGAVWENGDKDLACYRGADREFSPDWVDNESNNNNNNNLFRNARCFQYGSISLIDPSSADIQYKAMELARQQGLMISYDPNYRPTMWPNPETAHRVMFDAFRYAHVTKISEEEFEIVTGYSDLQKGIQAVLNQGVELVIVSQGSKGALGSSTGSGDHVFWVESPALSNIHVVETTGAGDAFVAAMLTRLLPIFESHGKSLKHIEHQSLRETLDYANCVAGLTCTKPGAIPALPTASQVDEFLAARSILQEQPKQKDGKTRHQEPPTTTQAKTLAAMIDHAMLQPNLVHERDIQKHCQQAMEYGFCSVAVHPAMVPECVQWLQGSPVQVGAAIGYPLGQSTTDVKVMETQISIQNGATEIDMVLNIRELQKGNYDFVQQEIQQVWNVCRAQRQPKEEGGAGGQPSRICYKVILETCYLSEDQIIAACQICQAVGVDFVKTSTGMGPAGATVEHVRRMRQTVGPTMGVKAAGGIRDLATAQTMISAGANRIGTSHGVTILNELLHTSTIGSTVR